MRPHPAFPAPSPQLIANRESAAPTTSSHWLTSAVLRGHVPLTLQAVGT